MITGPLSGGSHVMGVQYVIRRDDILCLRCLGDVIFTCDYPVTNIPAVFSVSNCETRLKPVKYAGLSSFAVCPGLGASAIRILSMRI